MRKSSLIAAVAALTLSPAALADDVADTLQRFVADYASDPSVTAEQSFGIRVGEDWYTVTASPGRASLREGQPGEPTFYFVTDAETLARVEADEINALTGMAKAFSSDFAPMDADVMEGFQPTEDFVGELLGISFHFWTMGQPEAIPFGRGMTRMTHGANAGIFYYQPGFRSGFFHIEPGQYVNEDERSRSNPFPSLFILTEGWAHARINGVEMRVEAGNAYFIPANHSHEFWLPEDADHDAFGFLFMFGDGA
ncbi:MAG: hypothetical protein GC208_06125 [Alphaproteobacteria bacterium]|nr:hypothetical protein [Alphaproteobacteria bacterium]